MIVAGVVGGGSGNEMSNSLEEGAGEAAAGVLIIEEGFFGRHIWKELRRKRPCLELLFISGEPTNTV